MAQSDRDRTAAYRGRMRAMGLRPIQIWVPDTIRPGFTEEVRRQVGLLRDQLEEAETLEFIDGCQDTLGWE